MARLTRLFPHSATTIRALRKTGLLLGIVSTKFRYRIETILSRADLLHLFDVIVGGEDVASHKPDPAGLNAAIERLGLRKADCLYVGDSLTDAEAAMRAGVRFIATLGGTTPRAAFEEKAVDLLTTDLLDLVEAIALC
jgi:phosphoglycolate phosphatase